MHSKAVQVINFFSIQFLKIHSLITISKKIDQGDLNISCESILRNGWRIYDVNKEFQRLGFDPEKWRISRINRHFQVLFVSYFC